MSLLLRPLLQENPDCSIPVLTPGDQGLTAQYRHISGEYSFMRSTLRLRFRKVIYKEVFESEERALNKKCSPPTVRNKIYLKIGCLAHLMINVTKIFK